jgi:hypothetical protein
MRESTLRVCTAVLFVVSHFITLILVGALYLQRGFTFDETLTTIAIITPLFAGYTTLIVKFIVANRSKLPDPATDPLQSGLFVFLSLFIPILFILVIVAIVLARGFNAGITTFEQFKILLGVVEGAFAVYVGLILNALFESAGVAKAVDSPPADGK